jgi:hypothetical protein
MKPLPSIIISVSVLALPLCVEAKEKKKGPETSSGTYGCAKFDANQNGVFEDSEKEEIRKAFEAGETALKALDTNNDGKLDEAELAVVKAPAPAPAAKAKKKKS